MKWLVIALLLIATAFFGCMGIGAQPSPAPSPGDYDSQSLDNASAMIQEANDLGAPQQTDEGFPPIIDLQ